MKTGMIIETAYHRPIYHFMIRRTNSKSFIGFGVRINSSHAVLVLPTILPSYIIDQ